MITIKEKLGYYYCGGPQKHLKLQTNTFYTVKFIQLQFKGLNVNAKKKKQKKKIPYPLLILSARVPVCVLL